MHWVFIVTALLNIASGFSYLRQRNKRFAIISFIIAGIVLVLGVIFRQ